jgi:hypothetical protein
MSRYNLTTYHGALPPEGPGFHTGKIPGVLAARREQPGVLLFVDFEKAFDRLDRPWSERCIAAAGFATGSQQWVSILHAGTTARVAWSGWSGFRLSLLGRADVTRQVLVSMLTYHGTFIPVPADILRHLSLTVVTANRPAAAGAAPLFPGREISTRIFQQGGIALADIPAQLTALQAKIIRRLLETVRVPWRQAYFSIRLAIPHTAEQRITAPAQSLHLCQLGKGLPISSFPTQSIQAPQRVVACLEAFRQLHPHRLVSAEQMPHQEVMRQPLFHSSQITHLGEPIAREHWARQGSFCRAFSGLGQHSQPSSRRWSCSWIPCKLASCQNC